MYAVRLLTEFLGSFFFIAIILATGEAIPVAVGLLSAVYFGGKISGGHFNPAVSTAMYARGGITARTYLGYVACQVLGGLAAWGWNRMSSCTTRGLITGCKMPSAHSDDD
jgi:aquaporin Z